MDLLPEQSIEQAIVIGDDGELLTERETNGEEDALSLPNRYLDQIVPFDRDRGFGLVSSFGGLLVLTVMIASIVSFLIIWVTGISHGGGVIPQGISSIPLGILVITVLFVVVARRSNKQKHKKN